MPRFIDRWSTAWKVHAFRDQLLISAAALVVVLIFFRIYAENLEMRTGIVFSDPILALFEAVEVKWIIVGLAYSGMLFGIVMFGLYPFSFLLALRSYVLMVILRVICLALLPLDPPAGIIPLVDPLVQLPAQSPVLTRDLFFSAHTAALAIFAFITPWRDMKIIFSSVAFAVSVLLLLQHAHYTIDVVAAPVFAYAAYGLARWVTVPEIAPGPARK